MINGLDIERFRTTMAAVENDHAKGKAVLSADSRWVSGTKNEISVRRFPAFTTDEPKNMGGENAAPNPVEYLISAAAGCCSIGFELQAAQAGVKLEQFEISARGGIDMAKLFGMEDGYGGLDNLVLTVKVKADADLPTLQICRPLRRQLASVEQPESAGKSGCGKNLDDSKRFLVFISFWESDVGFHYAQSIRRNTMKLSILNLAPVREGQTYLQAVDSMVNLAKHAERIGIERYWIAEHHNMKNLVSSTTALLIQHTLANTKTLRVGSGGVMLPNHSPYVVAEQYGTLETLYPNRVELGLGRAPGTDMQTAAALRRGRNSLDFPAEIAELRGYFKDSNPVSAYPSAGLNIPFYILGSSTESAYLAAELGLPYAFASHFAPRMMEMAVEIYRKNFKPSTYLAEPYVILGVNAVVAETDNEARQLATTQTLFFLNVVTNAQQNLQPPLASEEDIWKAQMHAQKKPHFGPVDFEDIPIYNQERAVVEQMTACSLIGSPESVDFQLKQLRERVHFDEIMAVSYIFDEQKQAQSYTMLKAIVDKQS